MSSVIEKEEWIDPNLPQAQWEAEFNIMYDKHETLIQEELKKQKAILEQALEPPRLP